LITHTITHIAHTLPLSAEWSHFTICKKLFDNVARSSFNCSIDNVPGAANMKNLIADALFFIALTAPVAYIFGRAIAALIA
jgi:hypothetical protein